MGEQRRAHETLNHIKSDESRFPPYVAARLAPADGGSIKVLEVKSGAVSQVHWSVGLWGLGFRAVVEVSSLCDAANHVHAQNHL